MPRRRTRAAIPPLSPTPPAYVGTLGRWCWTAPPAPRAERSLRVGARIGCATVTSEYWVPSRYAGRLSDHYVVVACDCGRRRGPIRATTCHNGRDALACRACVLDRTPYQSGPAHRNWRGVGALTRSQLSAIRRDAARARRPVLLSDEAIAALYESQRGRCAYSGVPLVVCADGRRRTASLERLDGKRPYEAGNVVFVHKALNLSRRTTPLARWVALAEAVAARARTDAPALPALDLSARDVAPTAPPVLPEDLGTRMEPRRKPAGNGTRPSQHVRWRRYGRYACARCGAEFEARIENVRSEHTRTCGCWGRDSRAARASPRHLSPRSCAAGGQARSHDRGPGAGAGGADGGAGRSLRPHRLAAQGAGSDRAGQSRSDRSRTRLRAGQPAVARSGREHGQAPHDPRDVRQLVHGD